MDAQQAVTEESAPSTEESVVPAEVVADPATAEVAAAPSETTEAAPGSEPEKELGAKGQEELKRLRKRAQEAEKREAYERGRAEALLASKTAATPPAESAASLPSYHVPMPEQAADESYEMYNLRLGRWDRQREAWEGEQVKRHAAQEARSRDIASIAMSQKERGEQKYDNFLDIAENVSKKIVDPTVRTAIIKSPVGEDVLHYLYSNPVELDKFSGMEDIDQIQEIGRLSDKIRAGALTQTKTNAPVPPPTVKATTVSNDLADFDPNMSTAERIARSRARKMERYKVA